MTVGVDGAAASPPTVGSDDKNGMTMGLGTRFYVNLVAAIFAIGLAVFIGFVLIDRVV